MPESISSATPATAATDLATTAATTPFPETSNEKPETSLSRTPRDLARLSRAAAAPRCGHTKTNGLPCHSPALKNNVLCYFHDKWLNNVADDLLPPLEDGNGVQFALMYAVGLLRREAFRDGQANIPAIKQMLYALQTASHNLRYVNFDPKLKKSTTDPFAQDASNDDDTDPGRKPPTSAPSA
jgi:hypothetical protein